MTVKLKIIILYFQVLYSTLHKLSHFPLSEIISHKTNTLFYDLHTFLLTHITNY